MRPRHAAPRSRRRLARLCFFAAAAGLFAVALSAYALGPRLRSDNAARVNEPPPIHVAYSICGTNDKNFLGLTSINSLLHARATRGTPETLERPLHLHITTDQLANESLPRTVQFRRLLAYAAQTPQVHLHWYPLKARPGAIAGAPGVCGAVRMQLLSEEWAHLPRLLYIDWDTTVHCDLVARWEGLFGFLQDEGAGLGMAPEGLFADGGISRGWYARHAGLPTAVPGGFSSGVLAIRGGYFGPQGGGGRLGLTRQALVKEFGEILWAGGYAGYAPIRALYSGDYKSGHGPQVRDKRKIDSRRRRQVMVGL